MCILNLSPPQFLTHGKNRINICSLMYEITQVGMHYSKFQKHINTYIMQPSSSKAFLQVQRSSKLYTTIAELLYLSLNMY